MCKTIILAGLTPAAQGILDERGVLTTELDEGYGKFPPHGHPLPRYRHTLDTGVELEERVSILDGDSATVYYKQLFQDGSPVPETSWDKVVLTRMAYND